MLDLQRLPEAVRFEGGVTRRLFLACGAALSSLPLGQRASWAQQSPRFSRDPFTLGVASGDPDETSVVLWTRLAPEPLEPFGGMPAEAVEVHWEIAEDEGFQKLAATGTDVATPQLAHSVHVVVKGLKPDRWYWYRFHAGEAVSPVGRTRTMPDRAAQPAQLKFAFASCQHYESGLFTAYEQMARDEPDLVCHLGDYIYEDGGRAGRVRQHAGEEIMTLADYRIRHSQYRADPLLHRMHALCPWLVTWDDHEVDNNYAGEVSEHANVTPEQLLLRRANAYQAYYEMMPLRPRSLPRGPDLRLYRHVPFGRLAEFFVLDTRQYRSDQPNGDVKSPLNAAALDPRNTLLGDAQRKWLLSRLIASRGRWNILAQQVMMGLVSFPGRAGEPRIYSMDQWPGYAHERRRLLEFLAERRVPNPVVLTGDIHSNWVNSLRIEDHQPETPVIATEFVGTSISSGGNGTEKVRGHEELLAHNPGVLFHNAERGYVRCTVTPECWTSEFVVVDDVTKPGGKVFPRAAFVVEAGRPGAAPA